MKAQGDLFVYPTGFSDVDTESLNLNLAVAQLVHYGLSNYAIASKLGITETQVQIRVGLYGLQWLRRRFRNGTTPEAEQVINTALRMSATRKADLSGKCGGNRSIVLRANKEARRQQQATTPLPKKANRHRDAGKANYK